ncbi:MAG: DMT family transporter [Verrucomicrobiota bacterium]|nr:DMT family transporter [Verrucomicrobiota bacterium]
MVFLLPLASAIIYPFASVFLKRAIGEGCGLLRTAFVSNMVLFMVFTCALPFNEKIPEWSHVGWALIAGLCFFGGQVFTFIAIRHGDVSIQSPMMGVKVIFVAFFSYILKPDEVPALIWIGSILAAAAIFLLGGASLKGFKENSKTVFWSLLACACFGGSDTLAGYRSSEFGEIPFIVIMVTVVAVLSILMIPFFSSPLRSCPKKAIGFAALGGLAIGVQGLILNLSLAYLGQATAMNIIYSTRALWGVLIVWILGTVLGNNEAAVHGNKIMFKRFAGAMLLSISVIMVFL